MTFPSRPPRPSDDEPIELTEADIILEEMPDPHDRPTVPFDYSFGAAIL